MALYRSQLEKLPPVNYVSTRRLMGHLHHISQNCEHNLMPVENLAAIWGPTLMHVDVSEVSPSFCSNFPLSEHHENNKHIFYSQDYDHCLLLSTTI